MRVAIGVVIFSSLICLLMSQNLEKPVLILPASSDCHAIDAWVQSHPSQQPQDLDHLLQFPESWRRRVLATSPPKVQAAVWSEQLANFLRETTGLAEVQKQVVLATLELVSTPPILCQNAPS